MTENEALEYLKSSKRKSNMLGILPGSDIGNSIIKALEEVQQYRAIGTLEECKIAVEKQRPKKPINPDDDYGTFKCPNCNGLIFTEDRFETHRYCLLCGQKLDWSDE
mgnify:CR=1 FL=1